MNRRSLFAGAMAAVAARLLSVWKRTPPDLDKYAGVRFVCAVCHGLGRVERRRHTEHTGLWFSAEDEVPLTVFEIWQERCPACKGTGR